ncbi:pyruvate dehydrogenase (acetyl-transferring) E1 component subunit alpha [Vibrio sp. Of7-15]|uniref:pyruvate dehydrogenase (acetyl-transferring) E1 component subunit alpha n=1 Tax=Vibrio sp. Of7-15 TaxID=2724879 RepID=UPI001EF2B653|nr:pyruvate dehydrogenase (acetyl-transferring) E1 component subunit alpha [Vibrio sp. Of7-15]MCG7497696.1 pyruvate dehydrogenase (acetyl-transferring) E1 component subunit alpha [Vibrio sp. Of7-15]
MNIQAIPCHRYLDENGEQTRPLPDWADKSTLQGFYRDMVLTRMYDKKAVALQRTGKLGTYPSHMGAEAIGIAVGRALKQDDVFIPYYRDMPAMWARGICMEKNLQYWGGDERGSDFYHHQDAPCRDLPFCVPIATQCTHAVGVASAIKLRAEHNAAIVTCGDGATSKGDFLESINCAGAWQLPLVFVINNNQWAISVPRSLQCGAEFLADKAKGAGMPGIVVDGNDIIAMFDTLLSSLKRAREDKGPTLIEAISYRLSDHTTADDASRYRSEDELQQAWQYEPIKRLKAFLINQNWWTEEQEVQWHDHCKSLIEQAVENYQATLNQPPETAFDYLYESLPQELHEQRDHIINRAMQQAKGGQHG